MLIDIFDLAGMAGQNFSGLLLYFLLLGEIFGYNVPEFSNGFGSVGFEHQASMILKVLQQEVRELLDSRRFELHGLVDNVVDKTPEQSADVAQIVCITANHLISLRRKVNLIKTLWAGLNCLRTRPFLALARTSEAVFPQACRRPLIC
jgi:hypothetical protein